jgi:hypothetical protein
VIENVGLVTLDGVYAVAIFGNPLTRLGAESEPPKYVLGTEAALVTVAGQTVFIADISI